MRDIRAGLALLLTLIAAGCSSSVPTGKAEPTSPPVTAAPRPPVRQAPSPAASTPYEAAVDGATRRGLQVWLDTDLAKFWLEGRASFDRAVRGLAALASRPGVVGFKIADELGYKDGFDGDSRRIEAFLADSARALRRAAPRQRILADFVVPQLGCAPGVPEATDPASRCRADAGRRYPALTLEALDRYLASGHLDVANISTGLLEDATYRGWGIDRVRAQRAAWEEMARLGWPARVVLQSRKALAHPDAFTGTQGTADDDLRVFVDIPREEGAAGTNIWTWRQTYQGQVVRLMDPGLTPNPLWEAIRARHQRGVPLFAQFTPSSVESDLDKDLDVLASTFSGLYVAAGLG